ncbi:MAG: hypothetical protein WCB12_12090 [Bryobacteraceae bacterium]
MLPPKLAKVLKVCAGNATVAAQKRRTAFCMRESSVSVKTSGSANRSSFEMDYTPEIRILIPE